ncbi:MAG: ankyrin repeat domain-containing protein [Candidatus Hydrogenedentes bacterium]|nr:ankyrin repeat domain-containing protein [Candidatus Hydrogenedentota bacterium]
MDPVKRTNGRRLRRFARFVTVWLIAASFMGVFQAYKLYSAGRRDEAEYRRALARVESAVAHGENINGLIEGGYTRLHLAVYESSPEVCPLLQLGASPNARDRLGSTPLHWASRKSDPELARALLESGADPGVTNQHGETPLDVAEKCIELMRKGASGGVDCTRVAQLLRENMRASAIKPRASNRSLNK